MQEKIKLQDDFFLEDANSEAPNSPHTLTKHFFGRFGDGFQSHKQNSR